MRLTISDIQSAVAETYGLPVEIIRAPDGPTGIRERQYARPRQVAMYLTHQTLGQGKQRSGRASLAVIGRHFGGRDHTTVLHACRVVSKLVRQDSEERRAVGEIGWKLIEAAA